MDLQNRNKIITIREFEALLLQKNLLLSHPTDLTTPIASLTPRLASLQPGDGFLAYAGVHVDGHQAIPQAIKQGAGFLVGEKPAPTPCPIPYLQVRNARDAWAWWESLRNGHPQGSLTLLGVTGTNGKSSVVWMTRALLKLSKIPCLSIGTLGAFLGETHIKLTHTTPDPDVLFPLLEQARRAGIQYVIMEVSSHSIEQGKVGPLSFSAAAFTNFSRDHLDFHLTLEAYWNTKTRLFSELLQENGTAIVNSALAARLLGYKILGVHLYIYGPQTEDAQPTAQYATLLPSTGIQPEGTPLSFMYENKKWEGLIPFIGAHNQENFLAALLITQTCTQKLPPVALWNQIPQIPGRLEKIHVPGSPLVLVDFAHKPGALAAVLRTARTLTTQKLWVLFGCGGDRDPGKRPQMGAIAKDLADFVCLTSDNPRSEDPKAIIREIEEGLLPSTAYCIKENRREAIAWILAQASEPDVVVIAGKGDETVQIYGDEHRPFSDSQVVRECLQPKAIP